MSSHLLEEDLYGVSDDETSSPSSTLPRTVHTQLNTNANASVFLDLPYEIRMMIYEEILQRAEIELWAHLEVIRIQDPLPRNEHQTRTCLIRWIDTRRKPYNKAMSSGSRLESPERLQSPEDIDAMADGLHFNHDWRLYHKTLRLHADHQNLRSYRYIAVLNLLASCHQIRSEILERIWAFVSLSVELHYSDFVYLRIPEVILGGLSHQFLGMPIGNNVQKLKLRLETLLGGCFDAAMNKQQEAVMQSARMAVLQDVLRLPKLRHVDLTIEKEIWGTRAGENMALETALDVLKSNKSIRSVILRRDINESVLDEWRITLGRGITVSYGETDYRLSICYGRVPSS